MAAIALGIVAFLVLFRPFGLSIDGGREAVVVLALGPLNFAALMLLHWTPLPRGWARAAIAVGLMATVNFAYLALFSNNAVSLIVPVGLVAGVVFATASQWRRHERLRREVIALREASPADDEPLVFEGEGGDTLRVPAHALRYAKSEGNYTRLVWRRGEDLAEKLLRTTLTGVNSAARGALVRCHRSYLVNLAAAERLEGTSRGMTVNFADGCAVPVSRSYVAAMRDAAKRRQIDPGLSDM
jgi:DNA-binding LytR/AlgR family response regulator